MTVSELIELLRDMPQDAEVFLNIEDTEWDAAWHEAPLSLVESHKPNVVLS